MVHSLSHRSPARLRKTENRRVQRKAYKQGRYMVPLIATSVVL